jgi:hypothetical protein
MPQEEALNSIKFIQPTGNRRGEFFVPAFVARRLMTGVRPKFRWTGLLMGERPAHWAIKE